MTTLRKAPHLPRLTRLAAYAIALDTDGRLLLVRIAAGYPAAGKWTLPGGGVRFGEDPQSAAERELTEETGLFGRVTSLAFVDSEAGPAQPEVGLAEWHAVRIVYRVAIRGGELHDEQDESTDAARWFTLAEVRELPVVGVVERALQHLEHA